MSLELKLTGVFALKIFKFLAWKDIWAEGHWNVRPKGLWGVHTIDHWVFILYFIWMFILKVIWVFILKVMKVFIFNVIWVFVLFEGHRCVWIEGISFSISFALYSTQVFKFLSHANYHILHDTYRIISLFFTNPKKWNSDQPRV